MEHYFSEKVKSSVEVISVKNVPRQNILKPAHCKFRLLNQEFKLGHRVVVTIDEGQVPLGEAGVVVGIDHEYLEILFDKPNIFFTNLEGRCSDNRGYAIYKSDCLNLTYKQDPISMASRPKSPPRPLSKTLRKASEPPKENKWNTPLKNVAPASRSKESFKINETRIRYHESERSHLPKSDSNGSQIQRNESFSNYKRNDNSITRVANAKQATEALNSMLKNGKHDAQVIPQSFAGVRSQTNVDEATAMLNIVLKIGEDRTLVAHKSSQDQVNIAATNQLKAMLNLSGTIPENQAVNKK